MSARDKLLSFTQPQLVEKRIKSLGDDPIFVRKLTMAEARKLHVASQKQGEASGKTSAEMLANTVCDTEGKPIMTTSQVDSLAGDVANELMQAVLEANGLGKKDDEGNAE